MNKKLKKVLDFFKNMSYFICVNRNDVHTYKNNNFNFKNKGVPL